MERRTFVFIVLSIGIWYGWLLLFPPAPPEEGAEGTEPATLEAPVSAAPAATTPAATAPGPAQVAPTGPTYSQPVEACASKSSWSNQGGALSDLTLDGYKAPLTVTPIYSWVLGGFGPWNPYGDEPGPAQVLTPAASAFAAGAGDLASAPVTLAEKGLGGVGQVGSLRIEQTLAEVKGPEAPCVLAMSVSWTNTGTEAYTGPVWLGAHDALPEGAGGMMARYSSSLGATAYLEDGVNTMYEYEEITAPVYFEGAVSWFGIADRYFAAYAVFETPRGRIAQSSRTVAGARLDGIHWVTEVDLAPGATHKEDLRIYIGPKDLDVMNAVNEDLGRAVELGWFSFFARPLLWMLKLFHAGVGNWGLAIILLTFTVKAVFFPLTQTAFKSGQAMQAIQPKLAKLKEEYADNSEELNRQTMALFKENKVNPFGGCLPMLIQFPVWIALYNVLLSSVELYQTEFLYLKDLSSADPYGVLPVIVVGLILLQQQFTPTGNMDPAQARMMKFMPLMFGVFFFTFPAGLVVYIFCNTVLSVLQQWFIKRTFATAAPTGQASGAT